MPDGLYCYAAGSSGFTGTLPKGVNAVKMTARLLAASQNTTSSAMSDVTGYTTTIVTTKTCTIVAFANMVGYVALNTTILQARLNIGGTAQETVNITQNTLALVSWINNATLYAAKTGVAAGTITVKVEFASTDNTNAVTITGGAPYPSNLLIFAIEE